MTNLADMQNSLFLPNLGAYLDRARPFRLSRPPDNEKPLPKRPQSISEEPSTPPTGVDRSDTELIQAGEYLVMPAGVVDWGTISDEERQELDEYVHYLLTSKRERLRRSWRGFKQYVRTPLGAFVVIYASLLTFWGAAWVLFIIGWLSAGARQKYFVEICDQVLTALFCTVGIGLAPFRAVDTYHMIYITMLHSKSLRLRRERHLPALPDENDLPQDETVKQREHVLSEYEQLLLEYHQTKFSSTHSTWRFLLSIILRLRLAAFYRPHETETHNAFPLNYLVAVVCVLDCHSLFQIALGSATWSISYHHNYKRILTAIILSFSICCNISGGILITIGNRVSRKKEVLERRLYEALSEEAIRRREKLRKKKIMHETLDQVRHEQAYSIILADPLNSNTRGRKRRRRPSRAPSSASRASWRTRPVFTPAAGSWTASRTGTPRTGTTRTRARTAATRTSRRAWAGARVGCWSMWARTTVAAAARSARWFRRRRARGRASIRPRRQ